MKNETTPSKPIVIKDYSLLDTTIQEKTQLKYPDGLSNHYIRFTDKDGSFSNEIEFETSEKKYLVRVSDAFPKKKPVQNSKSPTGFDTSYLDKKIDPTIESS